MKTKNVMKSVMIAAALLCGTVNNAQAQGYYDTENDLSIAIGGGSNSQIISGMSKFGQVIGESLISAVLTGGTVIGNTTYEDKTDIPTISVEYFRHVSKLVSIGGIAAFNGQVDDMYGNIQYNISGNNTTKKEKIGDAKRLNFTIMPAAKFDWLRKKNIGIYSKVAVGVSYMMDKQTVKKDGKEKTVDDSSLNFNFQASLFGFEAGTQQFRGFFELGVGEQGIALAGLRYKF